jgi:hypothetical protein
VLSITVPGVELWDEESEQFIHTEDFSLELEHSLASLSKWESIVGKPFLGSEKKTTEEVLLYIQCMAISTGVPSEVYVRLSTDNYQEIDTYINAKMTATWFAEDPNTPKSKEIVTSELIYYWMFSAGIPIECERWHLNRLFTLIRVFSAKNAPSKKKTPLKDMAAQRAALNQQRQRQLGTRG